MRLSLECSLKLRQVRTQQHQECPTRGPKVLASNSNLWIGVSIADGALMARQPLILHLHTLFPARVGGFGPLLGIFGEFFCPCVIEMVKLGVFLTVFGLVSVNLTMSGRKFRPVGLLDHGKRASFRSQGT